MIKTVFLKITGFIREFLSQLFFLVLLLVVLSVGFTKLWQWRKGSLLIETQKEVEESIEDTRRKAQEEEKFLNYGVSFADNSYTIFLTTSDWERRIVEKDKTVFLPKALHFADHNLVYDCNGFKSGCIGFANGSGEVLRINEKNEFNIVLFDEDTNKDVLIEVRFL